MKRTEIDGQLSLFDLKDTARGVATCVWEYSNDRYEVMPLESWAKKLVPNGVHMISVGEHDMVLYLDGALEKQIQTGHEYYHFKIDGEIYAGIFVGKGLHERVMQS